MKKLIDKMEGMLSTHLDVNTEPGIPKSIADAYRDGFRKAIDVVKLHKQLHDNRKQEQKNEDCDATEVDIY